ncbi:MAG TPA: prepilin-type N-terminal cleavage/methylation domain-containing protein [Anaeromyxobacteraceae bacterium]|nr:prepilin-type N-terminal cleavage/methylation domain-containing protein [Anaeromyxobacteraceae bacterium]
MTGTPRGLTLIEAMIAMVVMLIAAVGMLGLHVQGQRIDADALRIMRATAIAQDLTSQIALWPYADPRLVNADTANDAALGDPAFAFEATGAPPADHGEADLTLGGTLWNGIATADLPQGYERYWNVAYPVNPVFDTNGNGISDSMQIAVIVRWPSGGGFRRVVLLSVKENPAEAR